MMEEAKILNREGQHFRDIKPKDNNTDSTEIPSMENISTLAKKKTNKDQMKEKFLH